MKKKIGILTIGQSPRPDIIEELIPYFGENIEIIEAGALDHKTEAEISALQPKAGQRLLVTRLADGRVVHVAEELLTSCMQDQINSLEEKDVSAILILCTARFKSLHANVPCVEPGKLLNELIPLFSPRSSIGVLSPDEAQIESTKKDWAGIVEHIEVLTASPYGNMTQLELAAKAFKTLDIDLIVLDCMGYTEEMRRSVSEVSGKPVILSKVLAAKIVSAL